jgi:diacylglycerol O-acyltransferase / wax synthase
MPNDPSSRLEAGAQWGGGPVMSDMEALMWRSEASPRLRSGGVILEILDRVPDWDRFLAAHEWAVSVVPRLGDRVVDDPLRISAPEWVPDEEFDLAYHVRRARPGGGGFHDVLAMAQVLAMAPFDRERALWEAVLVEDLPDGGAAYLLKLHHSLLDGNAVIQLFDILHSDRPAPRLEKPTREVQARPPSGQLVRMGRQMGVVAGATRSGAGTIIGLAGGLVRRPEPTITDGIQFVQSLARLAGPPPADPSPPMANRSLSRRLQTLDVPLEWLRAAGKEAGGSVNDAFLAALTGGLRIYHEEAGLSPETLPIAFPVSLRRDDDPLGGNRFAGARIAGPIGAVDARDRIRLIRERVLESREEPALDFLAMLSPVLSRVPAPIVTRMTERVTRSIDLQASNIPGLARPAYVAGARVTRMYPFGPAPGSAVMVTMISHSGLCCIGINADGAAIPDIDGFAACIRAGFDEVLALAGHSLAEVGDDPSELARVGEPR